MEFKKRRYIYEAMEAGLKPFSAFAFHVSHVKGIRFSETTAERVAGSIKARSGQQQR